MESTTERRLFDWATYSKVVMVNGSIYSSVKKVGFASFEILTGDFHFNFSA